MEIHHLPTGTYETRAALAVRGGSWRDKRAFAASAILVRHPRGDLLLDAGFGAGLERHLAMLPRVQRSAHRAGRTVAEQLDAAGYDRSRLLGVLLTHAHWDHVSGLDGLPGVPIWMNDQERRYAARQRDAAVFREVSRGHEIRTYGFGDGPHLGFGASYDVHGDGSLIVVPAPGHTAGSVIVFVTLPGGGRYAFVGDLTWQLDGIRRGAERPWLMRRAADHDPAAVRADLRRMIALDDRFRIVPAHDPRAYEGIPLLVTEAPAAP